jgi:NtrC-family two-component system sensor histidine kinase KinB
LLNLSKIESGQITIEFVPVEVKLLIEKACSPFTIQAEEKKIKLTQEIPNNLPLVKADPNKITWVLTNLIGNAMRYTNSGGQIQISVQQRKEQVYLSVTDNGAGIPFEYQGKIFQKFVQVKTDKNAGGTGLGLAICKEIVQAHQGSIWVDSTLGQGSRFTFTLPVIADQSGKKPEGEFENVPAQNFNCR